VWQGRRIAGQGPGTIGSWLPIGEGLNIFSDMKRTTIMIITLFLLPGFWIFGGGKTEDSG